MTTQAAQTVPTGLQKQAIPSTTTTMDPQIGKVVRALQQNVELITGVRNGAPVLAQLPSSATLAEVIAAINIICVRLNQAGQ